MKFEEILSELRNGKSFRRKKDVVILNNEIIGFYFINLNNNNFNWYFKDNYIKQILNCDNQSLNSIYILSEDWELVSDEELKFKKD